MGISGHPGLVSDIYAFPSFRSGTYQISITVDDLGEYKMIEIVDQSCVIPETCFSDREIGLDNESHGGLMIGDYSAIKELKSHFDAVEDEDIKLWNALADGFCGTEIQEFTMPISKTRRSFAFVACQGWFSSVPLRLEDRTCGYRIECNLTHDGYPIPSPFQERIEIADRQETPTVQLNVKGWAKCPYCKTTFKPTDPNAWTGFRHKPCLSLLNLCPFKLQQS